MNFLVDIFSLLLSSLEAGACNKSLLRLKIYFHLLRKFTFNLISRWCIFVAEIFNFLLLKCTYWKIKHVIQVMSYYYK